LPIWDGIETGGIERGHHNYQSRLGLYTHAVFREVEPARLLLLLLLRWRRLRRIATRCWCCWRGCRPLVLRARWKTCAEAKRKRRRRDQIMSSHKSWFTGREIFKGELEIDDEGSRRNGCINPEALTP
jgi:hypothetical protein